MNNMTEIQNRIMETFVELGELKNKQPSIEVIKMFIGTFHYNNYNEMSKEQLIMMIDEMYNCLRDVMEMEDDEE